MDFNKSGQESHKSAKAGSQMASDIHRLWLYLQSQELLVLAWSWAALPAVRAELRYPRSSPVSTYTQASNPDN